METVALVKEPLPPVAGERTKLMMSYKPKCLCFCYETEVRQEGWEGEQVLKMERTLADCLMAPCCGNRVTVTGRVNGKVQHSFYLGKYSSSFINSEQGGSVSSMSFNSLTNPILWYLNIAYAGCCAHWSIYTQPANVDFFVANGIDGSESMGIHADHDYLPVKGCVRRAKTCFLLCPVSEYKTTAVRGPRLQGAPVIGTLASGTDGRCFCPQYGGVADIPANSSPEEMIQWTMLWGETMSFNGFNLLKKNWKNQVNIKQIQQMV
eukprot:TRINITY_DN5683_c3_g1_i2.p1 TRINITY_DN5683_c3_g1~~TRINITY_DN5683_c3_g1_i2.p1  ORF type:complete len:287 (+),score=48.80 TRINITY_DN5683_c3_g1_i2:70-861(+)